MSTGNVLYGITLDLILNGIQPVLFAEIGFIMPSVDMVKLHPILNLYHTSTIPT